MNTSPPPPTAAQRTAANLRAAMGSRNLKAGDLAKVLNISPQAAGRRYNGRHDFRINELSIIAEWVGWPIETLVANRDTRTQTY